MQIDHSDTGNYCEKKIIVKKKREITVKIHKEDLFITIYAETERSKQNAFTYLELLSIHISVYSARGPNLIRDT